jgi:transposase
LFLASPARLQASCAPPAEPAGNIRALTAYKPGCPFCAWVYRQRNAVERFFNKLKHFRAIATRYDKRDDNFLASVQLASVRIWLRSNESVI